MKRMVFLTLLLLLHGAAVAGDPCPTRVLVSDYTADDVRIFDGCDGSHLGDLDNGGRLDGPQAMRLGPDGMLYVVSEENGRVVRYDGETLQFVDIFIQTASTPINRPTGLAFGPDGDLFLAGFSSDNVGRFDGTSGQFEGIFASASGTLSGPDAGMVFGPDGHLYVPSFNTHQVVRFNGQNGNLIDSIVPAGRGGLTEPRVVLFLEEGTRMLVSSWGSNRVLEFAPDGSFVGELGTVAGPTGMDLGPNGELLVSTDQAGQISRLDPATGTPDTPFATIANSPVLAGTFLLTLGSNEPTGSVEQSVNEQFWIVGAGPIAGDGLVIEEAVSTTDGNFGDALDASAVQRPLWGRIEIDFTACDQADLRWFADDETYGDGGYSLVRLGATPAQADCEAEGFGATSDMDWIVGAWFGGEDRSGEGLLIDVLDGGLAFVAWFTYSP